MPNSAEAHSNLAITLMKLNRHAEAIASLDKALTIKPDNANAIYNRANSKLCAMQAVHYDNFLR
jgi:tetratricopeptide (TPR) repeat protein